MKSALFSILVIALLSLSCKKNQVNVDYRVSCYDCNVTYQNSSGSATTIKNVGSNWVYRFLADPGAYVSVSATNNLSSGTVTVWINNNTVEFKKATATAPNLMATVNGNLPK